ncbi:U3 small nucleolar ribonucleoprotein (snoRNP) subunit - Mpp10p, partial [Pseudoloma neurophilia]
SKGYSKSYSKNDSKGYSKSYSKKQTKNESKKHIKNDSNLKKKSTFNHEAFTNNPTISPTDATPYTTTSKWMFQGEVSACDRPVDSLLNLDLDYKQAQCIEKVTKIKEDEIKLMLRERIKEKNFDNFQFIVEQNENKEDDLPLMNDSNHVIMSIIEIKEMINILNTELFKISDQNQHISTGEKSKSILEIKEKIYKKKGNNLTKELKKHRNVEFI